MTTTTSQQNAEARAFAIAQIQAVMDEENAKRAANKKAHFDFVKRMNRAGLRKQFFDDHLGKMVDFKY